MENQYVVSPHSERQALSQQRPRYETPVETAEDRGFQLLRSDNVKLCREIEKMRLVMLDEQRTNASLITQLRISN